MSDGDVPVVRADLADPPPVFEDQLKPVFRLPGNLSLEREVAAPRLERAAARAPLGGCRNWTCSQMSAKAGISSIPYWARSAGVNSAAVWR